VSNEEAGKFERASQALRKARGYLKARAKTQKWVNKKSLP